MTVSSTIDLKMREFFSVKDRQSGKQARQKAEARSAEENSVRPCRQWTEGQKPTKTKKERSESRFES